MHSSLTLFSNEARNFIHTDFEIEKLDDKCLFTEGPVWNKEGFYLFSDIPANVIYKIVPGQRKQVYIPRSGCTHSHIENLSEQIGSNGLAYDQHGALFICQHGNGAVAKAFGGKQQIFLQTLQGKPFNSPNDIVVHSNGTVYFSDPPYGLKDQKLNSSIRQQQSAFYAWRNNEVQAFCTDYKYPNGLCLSPDENILYLCSSKPFEKFILKLDAHSLERKAVVTEENSDGMKCDRQGNLYLCTKEGIVIITPQGKRLARIVLNTVAANCCWGGANRTDLFITARENIFLIRGLQK